MTKLSPDKVDRIALTTDQHGMYKEFIESAKKAGVKVLTDQEREASRTQFLSTSPAEEDLWVFAYGSLMWNPVIEYIETRVGDAIGWHRDFCIHMPIGRGSVDKPGLMMALDVGGHCQGKVYRIAAKHKEHESVILWKRELNTDVYIPQWIEVHTPTETVKAFALIVDHQNKRYRKIDSLDEKAKIIASATGPVGSNKDYLFNTVLTLKNTDIQDSLLEELADKVRQLG